MKKVFQYLIEFSNRLLIILNAWFAFGYYQDGNNIMGSIFTVLAFALIEIHAHTQKEKVKKERTFHLQTSEQLEQLKEYLTERHIPFNQTNKGN